MKLIASDPSPYGRKVRIVLHELGIADQVEVEDLNPTQVPNAVKVYNPLVRVPALVLDDGKVLVDSPAIIEWLDHTHGGGRLIPAPGPARWQTLQLQALADGILDAAVPWVYESRRPEPLQDAETIARYSRTIIGGLDALEAGPHADALAAELALDPMPIGPLAVAAALGYLDFRLGHIAWRAARPRLEAAFAALATRPSIAATAPA